MVFTNTIPPEIQSNVPPARVRAARYVVVGAVCCPACSVRSARMSERRATDPTDPTDSTDDSTDPPRQSAPKTPHAAAESPTQRPADYRAHMVRWLRGTVFIGMDGPCP